MARISSLLLAARGFTILISASCIAVYIPIVQKAIGNSFVTDQPAITALPLIPLSLTVLWNIILIPLSLTKLSISKWVSVGDLTLTVGLVILGVLGFVHNDSAYYGESWWQDYTTYGFMIPMEIASIVCLGIAAILEVLIGILTIWKSGERARADRGSKSKDIASAYDQETGTVGVEIKKLKLHEHSFETEKASFAEAYQ